MNRIVRIIMGVMIITTSLNGVAQVDVVREHYRLIDRVGTMIHPARLMKFRSHVIPEDTIYMGVLLDSVARDAYSPIVFIYYPKNIDPTGSVLSIGFPDGTINDFPPYRVDLSGNLNYVEYELKETYYKLKIKSFDYLSFGKISQVIKVAEPNYFKDFFNLWAF